MDLRVSLVSQQVEKNKTRSHRALCYHAPEPTEVESSQVSFVSSMAATAANIDSNGRLRMASMAMAEVGLERGSDTTQKQNLAATHAHCTAGPAIRPTQLAYVA